MIRLCGWQMMEGWFLGAPIASIRHDNVSSWVSWAFFGHDEAEMTAAEKLKMKPM